MAKRTLDNKVILRLQSGVKSQQNAQMPTKGNDVIKHTLQQLTALYFRPKFRLSVLYQPYQMVRQFVQYLAIYNNIKFPKSIKLPNQVQNVAK